MPQIYAVVSFPQNAHTFASAGVLNVTLKDSALYRQVLSSH